MQNTPMTIEGAEKLREELQTLKSDTRPKIITAIAEAREHGDLKENAEYHAAREQQSFCEGRINEIESKLGAAQIIDVSKIPQTGKVVFGTTVELFSFADDKVVTYQIVGDDEANVSMGKISVSSPIARAMMGKAEGDEIVVNAPSGDIEYEIQKVRHI